MLATTSSLLLMLSTLTCLRHYQRVTADVTTADQSASGACVGCCNYDATVRRANIRQTIDYVFGLQKRIDVVFVVKTSQGFEQQRLKQVLTFISDLVDYVTLRGWLVIHPDYGRVSILTFADNVITVMNGVADSTGYYDACRFHSYLAAIQLSTLTDSSDPYPALAQAAQAFAADASRNATRSLFYFDNGANWQLSSAPDTASADVNNVVTLLRAMRVHRFAAGVGLPPIGWMDTLQLEQNVQSVASDVMNYYACMDDWSAAIGDAILLLRNGSLATTNSSAHVYTYSPVSGNGCFNMSCYGNGGGGGVDQCGCQSPLPVANQTLCACDVTLHQYTCLPCNVIFPCSTPRVTTTTARVTTGSWSSEALLDRLTWTIVIVATCAGFVLLLILLIITGVYLRHRQRLASERRYVTSVSASSATPPPPTLPPPPVLPPRAGRHQGQTPEVERRGSISPRNGGDSLDNDVLFSTHQMAEPKPSFHSTPNIIKEEGMPGWCDYLSRSVTAGGLERLCVVALSGRRWAQTLTSSTDRLITIGEVKAVESLLKFHNRRTGFSLMLASAYYTIDWDGSAEDYLRAWRYRVSRDEGSRREVAIATVASHKYAVVGLAAEARESQCLAAVRHVAQHLHHLIPSQIQRDLDQGQGSYIAHAVRRPTIAGGRSRASIQLGLSQL